MEFYRVVQGFRMRDFNCSGFRVRGVRLSGLGLGYEVCEA